MPKLKNLFLCNIGEYEVSNNLCEIKMLKKCNFPDLVDLNMGMKLYDKGDNKIE